MGKSFYIQKLAKSIFKAGTELDDNTKDIDEDGTINKDDTGNDCYRVVPIHGPRVDTDSLVKAFDVYLKNDSTDPCIYHIDISQTVCYLGDMGADLSRYTVYLY